jgi:hypothetical protein
MYKTDMILASLRESLSYSAPEAHEAHWQRAHQDLRALFEGSKDAEANWPMGRDLIVFDDESASERDTAEH